MGNLNPTREKKLLAKHRAEDYDIKMVSAAEVSPISYLGMSAFVISFLVEKGHLKVRRDGNGLPHFMKSDMDEFLLKVSARLA